MTPANAPQVPPPDRPETMTIRAKFDARWTPEPNTGCWLWMGATDKKGYGCFYHPDFSSGRAHRIAWEMHKSAIPLGMVLDHICRNPSCVNPDHLRVVTPKQNTLENSVGRAAQNAQKTHCRRGHPLSGDNLRIYRNRKGWVLRCCKACGRIRCNQHRHAARLAARSGRKEADDAE